MRARARLRAAAALIAAVAATGGCGAWHGLNSLPLPGTAGRGPDSFEITAQLPDVTNIQQNSRVRVGDVTVGNVTRIERQGWHALVTMRLDGDVDLPANATATVGQTSLLGSLHIELAPPSGMAPQGRLHSGSSIPLSATGAYPTTEQTLSAVSMLLNGGGLSQVQDITAALSMALASGRDTDLRNLLKQLSQFIDHLNAQTDDIIHASDSLNRVVGQFSAEKSVVDQALRILPDALAVLANERGRLTDTIDQLGKLSAVGNASVSRSKAALVDELKDLGPVVESLANAGPALTRSLSVLLTFPFPKETLSKWVRGDYANTTTIVDLTLSRIDAGFFTGTRWEGNLTELEMQWGRTIGELPSPFTSGNPLMIPYHFNQGS
ncbi:MAG TPA: MCE family protein [Mycobacterium sp.]|nr:MCE family protein [Mycobacterium sp.]